MKAKKRILIFIDWYLPGYKAGGPIQSCANLIAHLKDEFHFSVVTRDTDYCETTPYKNVKSDEWNQLPDGTKVYYFSKKMLNRKGIKKIIDTEQYDVVYLNGIFSTYFTLCPLYYLNLKKNGRVVIAARGMFARGALKVKRIKKRLFLLIAQNFRLFKRVVFHATTHEEEADIKRVLGKKANVIVASNLPASKEVGPLVYREKRWGDLKLVNIARIAPEKNLKLVLEILKKVKGEVHLDIYGTVYDQQYWKECQDIIQQLRSNIIVQYKQTVESKLIHQTLLQYHYMIMPTLGENFGHIILESFTAGCPVIISDQTVWKDLQEKNVGWDIPLSDPEKYVKVLEQCIATEQLEYDLQSKAAHQFALDFINNEELLEGNRQLFS